MFISGQRIYIVLLLILASGVCRAASQKQKPSSVLAASAMRLLHNNCLSCHNSEKLKGGLDLSSRTTLLKGGDNGPAAVGGQPAKSLIVKVLAADSDPHMPPKKQLSTNQIELMRRWVATGIPWDETALAKAAAPREVTLAELPESYQPVFALALSPDETRLAVGRGNRIVIYDVGDTNFSIVAEREAHKDVVRSLAWSTNGEAIASGSFRELVLWEINDLKPLWSVASNLLDRVTVIRFAGDKLLAADGGAGQGGWLRAFAVNSGAPLSAWQAHADTIYDLAVTRDGARVASAGGDGLVKFWDIASQTETSRIEAHLGAVFGVAFNTNASEVATVGADKQFKVWDTDTRESIVTDSAKRHAFVSLAWSADGKTVIAGSDGGQLMSFSEFKRHSGAQSSDTARERELGKWREPLHAVAIAADGKRAFAGGHDGVVYAVKSDGKLLGMLPPSDRLKAELQTAPSFVRDILPAMAKAGCMAGSCHAKAEGQNGFKLSVFSYDPAADYAEIVKEGRSRRVFPAAPEESLILLKPTMTVDHGGGQRFEPDSDTYNLLVRWIRAGMPYQHTNEPSLASISVEPKESTSRKRASRQLKVAAHYSDGSIRDVTGLAEFTSNDKEMVQVDETGFVRIGTLPGESAVIARYMGSVDATRIRILPDRLLPSKRYAELPANNFIDELAWTHFRNLGLFPSELCTDTEFIRRSSLDTVGVLPGADEARGFLASTDPNKRAKWIERLLEHPAYGDYWANKWADLLRPNPDRVGVKSVFLLDQWLREAFRGNKSYDQFVRDLLLAEGSNHRHGPAVVYRDRREPPELTTIFSQLFLGTRMECAKCHHHPTEKWSQDDFYQFAAFFGPLKQKGAGLSPPISAGTETFYFAPGGKVKHPVTEQVMDPRPPDGPSVELAASVDPRRALVDWLVNSTNSFFARAAVNRVWGVFFGRGFVEPVDDFRSSNPVANEPLLRALAEDFVRHNYDLKHLMGTILSSRLYQLSSTPNEFNLRDTKHFSRSYRRRLPAEVLLDAVCDVTGVPETFEGCPPGTRAIQTWTYKIDSHFLDAFSRPNPSTDCPCERDSRSSVVQSLHMMNSRALQAKLSHTEGRVKQLASSALPPERAITELYLAALSRYPTATELKAALGAYSIPKGTRQTATEDILWALLNSPEFVFNH